MFLKYYNSLSHVNIVVSVLIHKTLLGLLLTYETLRTKSSDTNLSRLKVPLKIVIVPTLLLDKPTLENNYKIILLSH